MITTDKLQISTQQLKELCKIGQGNRCCRYLTVSSQGFECDKHTDIRELLDTRVNDGPMAAHGDNCKGLCPKCGGNLKPWVLLATNCTERDTSGIACQKCHEEFGELELEMEERKVVEQKILATVTDEEAERLKKGREKAIRSAELQEEAAKLHDEAIKEKEDWFTEIKAKYNIPEDARIRFDPETKQIVKADILDAIKALIGLVDSEGRVE